MAYLLERKKGKLAAVEAKISSPEKLFAVLNPVRWKLLNEIAKKASYPSELAEKLKLNEQKVFYHINQLRKAELIEVERKEEKRGGVAKYYKATSLAFGLKLPAASDFEFELDMSKKRVESFLKNFITKGKFDMIIVVGSPDPHGPEKGRARDGHYAVQVGMFLASIASCEDVAVKTDTEVRDEDKKGNLILIGGPLANRIVGEVNSYLPIRLEREKGWDIYSGLSGEIYGDENAGLIVEVENPWNSRKRVLILAGKHASGTKAAAIAFTKEFDRVKEGNVKKKKVIAKVVEGIDIDGDGLVDSVEIRE